jgi:hypothetical protein
MSPLNIPYRRQNSYRASVVRDGVEIAGAAQFCGLRSRGLRECRNSEKRVKVRRERFFLSILSVGASMAVVGRRNFWKYDVEQAAGRLRAAGL